MWIHIELYHKLSIPLEDFKKKRKDWYTKISLEAYLLIHTRLKFVLSKMR